MRTVWQDVRYGARMLGRNPGLTVTAVLCLGLGEHTQRDRRHHERGQLDAVGKPRRSCHCLLHGWFQAGGFQNRKN